MKRTSLICTMLIALMFPVLLVGQGGRKSKAPQVPGVERQFKLEGTWRLVSGTRKTADTTFSYSHATYFGIKMIYKNHVAWFGQGLRDGDTLAYYGGGTYTLEGNNYTESIEYSITKSAIGKVIPFEVEVRNDTLIQKGPRKIGKYQDSKWELYEVWERMK